MRNNHVQQALNNTLSSLYVTEQTASDLLAQAKGGKKVKRKLSVAFILTMIFIAISVTALAVITIREFGRQVAQNEQQHGYFVNWTLEQKTRLINSLIELKVMEDSEKASNLRNGVLSGQEAHEAANQLVAAFTGEEPHAIHFITIMQVPMGPVDNWTYEEKAWYSKLMREVGIEGGGMTEFVTPSGKISEQEAINIARREVAAGYKVAEHALDPYKVTVSFEIPEANEPGNQQAYWRVAFLAPENMSEEERLFILFPVFVHPENGSLLRSVQDMLSVQDYHTRPSNDIYDTYQRLLAEVDGAHFRNWPLALRARFSSEIAPKVQEVVASKDLSPITLSGSLDVELIAQSSYVYGLPGDAGITQEQALDIAENALAANFNAPEGMASLYHDIPTYYDVTDEENPLWKFIFNGKAMDWSRLDGGMDHPFMGLCFRVEVDALTGELVHVEQFEFKMDMGNLAYRLKWY